MPIYADTFPCLITKDGKQERDIFSNRRCKTRKEGSATFKIENMSDSLKRERHAYEVKLHFCRDEINFVF